MNITLREVYQTSADADRFWKLKECYIRGSTIKYLRIPDKLLDEVKEEQSRTRDSNKGARGGAGGGTRGGRGAPTRGMYLQSVPLSFFWLTIAQVVEEPVVVPCVVLAVADVG